MSSTRFLDAKSIYKKNQSIFPCTNKKQLENNSNIKYLKHGLYLMKDVKDHRKL